MHFNVGIGDIVRAVDEHPSCGTHNTAIQLQTHAPNDEQQKLQKPGQLQAQRLANHLYIALTKLVKLKPT